MFFLLIVFQFLISQAPTFAIEENFIVNENIEYSVTEQEKANVTHSIIITNKDSQKYPSEYQLSFKGYQLSQVNATDDKGNALQSFKEDKDVSIFNLKFNQPKVGKDQQNEINLTYTINNFVKHKGKTWEILLPQIVSNNNVTRKIITPISFGSLSFSSIPLKFEPGISKNQIILNSQQRENILIIFGNYQLFDFKLNYHLKNNHNQTVTTEIAIIPDTHSQSVYYRQIEPAPENIKIDPDGNWLAQYTLKTKQELNIIATGQVKTGFELPQTLESENDFIGEQIFWPVNDTKIQDIAKSLDNPKSIYDYVTSTLEYNYDRWGNAGRLGALSALSEPQNSLCTEFTDLFVTLARAKNIPAREIEGFAYTNNPEIKPTAQSGDILHAWPEFYNSKTNSWQEIDPTWGKTTGGLDFFNKLDLNHITFVIHGYSSQYPLPPGSYRHPNSDKSVEINFATEEFLSHQELPRVAFQKNKLLFNNSTPNSIKGLFLSIPKINFSKNIDTIMPYSSSLIEIPRLNFWQTLNPSIRTLDIVLKNSEDKLSTQTLIYPPYFINLGILIISGLIILSLSGIIITRKKNEKTS